MFSLITASLPTEENNNCSHLLGISILLASILFISYVLDGDGGCIIGRLMNDDHFLVRFTFLDQLDICIIDLCDILSTRVC